MHDVRKNYNRRNKITHIPMSVQKAKLHTDYTVCKNLVIL